MSIWNLSLLRDFSVLLSQVNTEDEYQYFHNIALFSKFSFFDAVSNRICTRYCTMSATLLVHFSLHNFLTSTRLCKR
jgi:hypothetical protein